MYLEEVEAVLEKRTVDKCLLDPSENLPNLHKDIKGRLNKPIMLTYLRSYYTTRSMQLY